MVNFVNLRKTASGWEFDSEEALEDFVWANLPALFGLTPLKRQHIVKGQFCDILALGENNELVVLELKNGEDRYIVQQLTRYYDALREEKPFSEQIDYDRPIRLVAVAPSFHRDNFTDRKYSHLSVEFLHFEILTDEGRFYLQLKNVEPGKVTKVEIPHQEKESSDNISTPPRKLLNFLAKCNNSSEREREAVLGLRRKILCFDSRMQEIIKANSFEYGKGKSNPCAELYFSKSYGYMGRPNLFLRLPEPDPWYKQSTKRMLILVDRDWNSFSGMIYLHKQFNNPQVRVSNTYEFPAFINRIKRDVEQGYQNAITCYQKYEIIIANESNYL